MLRKMSIVIFALVFLVGLGLFLYPTIYGAIVDDAIRNNADAFINSEITDGQEELFDDDRPYAELWAAMQSYNASLTNTQQQLLRSVDDYIKPSFVLTDYGLEDNTFGVISIPKLDVNLPILLGASEENMAKGAVHLSQTSLPIGGENTNSVIAAHRGWNGASYFLNIHKLTAGDIVTVTNLWETLTYEVTEIKLIAPNEAKEIYIQEGRELLTLMSCHPIGSGGKQRYLVFCERVETEELNGTTDEYRVQNH